MSTIRSRTTWIGAGAATLALVLAACSGTDQPGTTDDADATGDSNGAFYQSGEVITIVNPFSPGGGNDTSIRFMTPYFEELLPNNPAFQVVNITGAGGTQGANQFVERMGANGRSLLYTSGSNNFLYLFGDPQVEYDYKTMTPVFGLPTGRPLYVPADYPSAKELVESGQEVIFAMEDPLGAYSVDLIGFEILGINVRDVGGYTGAQPMQLAMEQGEIDMFGGSTGHYFTSMVPLIEDGDARGFLTHGLIDAEGNITRDPAMPEIPTLVELYEEIYGEQPSGIEFDTYKSLLTGLTTMQKVLWLHEDAPAEAVETWDPLCEQLRDDDEFFEEGKDLLGPYRLYCGDDLRNIITKMVELPEENLNWALDFLVENYGATDPRQG